MFRKTQKVIHLDPLGHLLYIKTLPIREHGGECLYDD